MTTDPKLDPSLRTRVENAVALAGMLQRTELGQLAVSADQYRRLVERLKLALDADLPQRALTLIVDTFPAAGELYENMRYAHAGLSRAPLERSVATERLARELLQRLGGQQRAA
jgi:hypothetical protein